MHACRTANVKICAGWHGAFRVGEGNTHSHIVLLGSDWWPFKGHQPIRSSGLPLDIFLSDWSSSAKPYYVQEAACTAATHTVTEETHHSTIHLIAILLGSSNRCCSKHAGRCSPCNVSIGLKCHQICTSQDESILALLVIKDGLGADLFVHGVVRCPRIHCTPNSSHGGKFEPDSKLFMATIPL